MILDWNGLKALRQARFTTLMCVIAAPAVYAAALASQHLGGRWQRFFEHPERIPWRDPRAAGLTVLAAALAAAAVTVPSHLRAASPVATLRLRALVAAVLALGASICGLALGAKLGAPAAPLALALLLLAPLAGLARFPTRARWERELDRQVL